MIFNLWQKTKRICWKHCSRFECWVIMRKAHHLWWSCFQFNLLIGKKFAGVVWLKLTQWYLLLLLLFFSLWYFCYHFETWVNSARSRCEMKQYTHKTLHKIFNKWIPLGHRDITYCELHHENGNDWHSSYTKTKKNNEKWEPKWKNRKAGSLYWLLHSQFSGKTRSIRIDDLITMYTLTFPADIQYRLLWSIVLQLCSFQFFDNNRERWWYLCNICVMHICNDIDVIRMKKYLNFN